jgi:hypothetical protein
VTDAQRPATGGEQDGELLPGAPEGEHCLHWQEGDGDCCRCGLANWCPEDGWPESAAEELPPVTGCPGKDATTSEVTS